jgi:hypothetical protein
MMRAAEIQSYPRPLTAWWVVLLVFVAAIISLRPALRSIAATCTLTATVVARTARGVRLFSRLIVSNNAGEIDF